MAMINERTRHDFKRARLPLVQKYSLGVGTHARLVLSLDLLSANLAIAHYELRYKVGSRNLRLSCGHASSYCGVKTHRFRFQWGARTTPRRYGIDLQRERERGGET